MNGGDQDPGTPDVILESIRDTGADLTTVTTGIVTMSHSSNMLYREKEQHRNKKHRWTLNKLIHLLFFAFILGKNA